MPGSRNSEESLRARLKRIKRAVAVNPGTGRWLQTVVGMNAVDEMTDTDALLMSAAALVVRGIVDEALKGDPPVWGDAQASKLNSAFRQWATAKGRIEKRYEIGEKRVTGDWTDQLITRARTGRKGDAAGS